MILIFPLKKAFVKVPPHIRKGKQVGGYSYFDARQKKVTHVKHTKKTRVDYSEKDAKLKIQFLNAKKNHHNSQIEAAKELKEKVASHKAKGNTTFKMGDKHHDIHKVTKDLNDHISHHSNEVKSHDNHISKIKDRYKTDRGYFAKKKPTAKKETKKFEVKKNKDFLTPENLSKESLIAAGGKYWEKGNIQRVYVKSDQIKKLINWEKEIEKDSYLEKNTKAIMQRINSEGAWLNVKTKKIESRKATVQNWFETSEFSSIFGY